MVRPLLFIVPSLLVGGVVGFLVAGALSKPSRVATKSRDPSAEVAVRDEPAETTGFFGSSSEVDYDKLARACLRAAGSSTAAREAEERPLIASSPQEQSEAAENLARVEELALEHGKWSRLAGFRAQSLLAKLPPAEAREFEARLSEQIRQGALTPQAGAWIPGGQEH